MSQSLEQTRCKLPRVLSQGNHTGFAEFPQQRVVTTCIKCLSTREVHQRLSIHDIDWVLAIQTPSVSYIPTIQTSRRKAGVQHKPYCLHKQSGHREPLFSVQGMGETSGNSSSQMGGQSCKQAFLMRAVSGLLCQFFSVQPLLILSYCYHICLFIHNL